MKTEDKHSAFIFHELLKEEQLKPASKVQVPLEISKPENRSFKYPVASEITEDEIKNQWKLLRNYFRTGVKTWPDQIAGIKPVLLAPYLKSENLNTDYPVFLSMDIGFDNCPFSELLTILFNQIFKAGEADIVLKYLPRVKEAVGKYVVNNNNFCSLKPALDYAFDELTKLKIQGSEGARFFADVDTFRKQINVNGNLLGFSSQVPLQLLAHLLKFSSSGQNRKDYITEIHRLKAGLQDLMKVERDQKANGESLNFAGSFIQINKLDGMLPERSSEPMSKQRAERIENCIKVLETYDELFLKHSAIVYVGKTLSDNLNFNWNEISDNIDVRYAPVGESCSSILAVFNAHVKILSQFIAAVRIAGLELKNRFDEEIHGDFFARFNWHYFTEEEINLCPPVILIDETQNLLQSELHNFSALIASNKPVRILAINKPSSFIINKNGNESNDLLTYQQELSAISISHRNAFTLQSAAHNPLHMLNGMAEGLNAASPALFHILFSPKYNISENLNFLDVSSAVEGRQFPIFTYNVAGEKWGSRFDISANPEPKENWPHYAIEIESEHSQLITIDLAFTFADYFAVNPINCSNLQIVPKALWSDDLISLSEYLNLAPDKLYAKVPFIWLCDGTNTLHKAAIPYSLVIASKERLSFWNFLQELSGVNSYHVEQALKSCRNELNEQKVKEINALHADYAIKLENVRATAAGEAMNRLAGMLLDIDNLPSKLLPHGTESFSGKTNQTDSPSGKLLHADETVSADTSSQTVSPLPDTIASTEAWVESFRCTSCNECVDKYPRAFKYDGEKLAYVDDPTTVTFAQLVKAAEDCPAKCIHPGMPLNPNEPGLETLIAKAKTLN